MKRVLDAWALLALFRGEPAAERIEEAMAGAQGVISWINLGEVYYQEMRRLDEAQAREAVRRSERIFSTELPDGSLVLEASSIKAGGGLSYADSFAVATAARHDAPLLTGDPEIVEAATGVKVIDLR